jgi:DinB superfamily
MTVQELVLDQLITTFDEGTWQPPLSKAMDGLNARQAAWKPSPERHSIWQIVRHVILWKRSVLEAWDGVAHQIGELHKIDWGEASGTDAEWQADVRTLHAISEQLKERVRSTTDEILATPMPTYRGARDQIRAMRIVRTATHDIYHSGQIQYLRALQGI